jgi:hypothetical protein
MVTQNPSGATESTGQVREAFARHPDGSRVVRITVVVRINHFGRPVPPGRIHFVDHNASAGKPAVVPGVHAGLDSVEPGGARNRQDRRLVPGAGRGQCGAVQQE